MSLSVSCDHCHRIIEEVAYEVRPIMVESLFPLHRIGTYLHYDCIVPWRQRDA